MDRHGYLVACVMLVLLGIGGCASEVTGTSTAEPSTASIIQEARHALEDGNVDAALDKLAQAERISGSSAEIHFLMGNAFVQKEELTRAEQEFSNALEIDASYVDARSNLGVVYYRQRRLEEAEQVFRKALEQLPNDAELHYNLGGVLLALGHVEEALDTFWTAQAADPSLAEPYLGLGNAYRLLGERDRAIAALQEYAERTDDPVWRAQAEDSIRELQGQQ